MSEAIDKQARDGLAEKRRLEVDQSGLFDWFKKAFAEASTPGNFNASWNNLSSLSKDDIKNRQEELSNAGLYPPKGHKYYRDGVDGPVTQHAMRLASEPGYAEEYLKTALTKKNPSQVEVMQMQAALNRAGFASGDVDGKLDGDTRLARANYLKAHPDVKSALSPDVEKEMGPKTGIGRYVEKAVDTVREVTKTVLHGATTAGHTPLNEGLAKAMGKNPQIAQYVEWTREAALKNGLDGNMLANQFWQESKFKPNAVSPKGAMGISQMIVGTAKGYGLSESDLFDPRKSIEGGAKHMGDLSRKHGQEMALIGYNGGEGAIKFVQKQLGRADITVHDWMSYMSDRRETKPTAKAGAWQNETFQYVEKITGLDGGAKSAERLASAAIEKAKASSASTVEQGKITTGLNLVNNFTTAADQSNVALAQPANAVKDLSAVNTKVRQEMALS